MTEERARQDHIAAEMLAALVPPHFPLRRDLELDGAVSQQAGYSAFFDYLWPQADQFMAYVLAIRENGVKAAARLAGLKELIRAGARLGCDIACLLRDHACGSDVELGLVRVDMRTGQFEPLAIGGARLSIGGMPVDRASVLHPGDVVWLATGDAGPIAARVPVEGLGALVASAVDRSRGGGGLALHFTQKRTDRVQLDVALSNDVAEIPDALEKVMAFLETKAVDPTHVTGIDIALDELLTNSIAYGFGDARSHEIGLTVIIETDRIVLEIQDDGIAFNPLGIPAPDLDADIDERKIGGLGIHFVRQLLDNVHYRRANGWNILTLEKERKAKEIAS